MTVPDLESLAEFAEDTGDLDLDALLDVLSNGRRRFVISRLQETERPMALPDLAADLVRRERGVDADDLPTEAVQSARVSLYHVHVPRLVDAGLVEYDDERDAVALTDDSRALARDADVAPLA